MKTIEKSVISFRISLATWMRDNRFEELMALFEKNMGVTDEVTFFTSATHSCLSLDIIKKRADIIAKRMDVVRQKGYRTGINHLTTIGFVPENKAESLQADYGRRTLIDGRTDVGRRCSNDPEMRNYICEVYRILTETGPDYIWLDDDVHAGECFCVLCLERFAEIAGRYYSREELKAAFNEGTLGTKLNIRQKWIDHSNQTVCELLELVAKTVHGISPKMPLGLMTGDRFPEGYAFDRWAKILAGQAEADVMWRPGEGFWTDESPSGLIAKSHSLGRQISALPDNVKNIQVEVESFTYQRLKKSRKITALEPAVGIAVGATGAALNVLAMYESEQPLDEYESLVASLHKSRPFYDLLAEKFGRSKPQGIYTGWNENTFKTMNLSRNNWYEGDARIIAGNCANDIFELGLPAAYSLDNSQVTILIGDAVRSILPETMRKILSGGVYMDVVALENLNQMGYGEFTGFDVQQKYDKDCIEQLVAHPLNGAFDGQCRDGRQAFNFLGCAALIPHETSQILSRLVDYTGDQIARCSSGIFENDLGGRVHVAGYFPYTSVQYFFKSSQLKSVFRWLSKDTLPAYIASYHKTNLWVRKAEEGRQAMALLNDSMDSAQNIDLMIKTPCSDEITVYDMQCASKSITASGEKNGYKRFVISEILPWEMILVCNE